MIGKMGFAVVAAVDLVAVEISIVPETHGFRWRARLYTGGAVRQVTL